MCLILFAYRCHSQYPLILAANRDEFYQRPTSAAHWWPDTPDLLAGQDLEAGGTWMGMNRQGRFAAVTNVREPQVITPSACSRGLLPRRYLEEGLDNERFCGLLQETWDQYRGYNLLFGTTASLYYFSNRDKQPLRLQPGVYGLSNAQLDSPWPKVVKGKYLLSQLLDQPELTTSDLLQALSRTEIARDDELPSTGLSLEWERTLSAICIQSPDYGTRSSTSLLIDGRGQVQFHERQLAPEPGKETRIRFKIS